MDRSWEVLHLSKSPGRKHAQVVSLACIQDHIDQVSSSHLEHDPAAVDLSHYGRIKDNRVPLLT